MEWELNDKITNSYWVLLRIPSDQIRSVAQSCLTLCNPMNRSMPGLPVHHQLQEFTETHVHRVRDAIQPCHPLSSPSPPAPNPSSIRIFSNESTLRMRWPKYWSFGFSIIPSKEIPGLNTPNFSRAGLNILMGMIAIEFEKYCEGVQFQIYMFSSFRLSWNCHPWPIYSHLLNVCMEEGQHFWITVLDFIFFLLKYKTLKEIYNINLKTFNNNFLMTDI